MDTHNISCENVSSVTNVNGTKIITNLKRTSVAISCLSIIVLLFSFYYHAKKFLAYRSRLEEAGNNLIYYVSLIYLELLIIYRNVFGILSLSATIGWQITLLHEYHSSIACKYFLYQMGIGVGTYFIVQVTINITIIRTCRKFKKFGDTPDANNNMKPKCFPFFRIVKLIKGSNATYFHNIIAIYITQIIVVSLANVIAAIDVFRRDSYLCFKQKPNNSGEEKYFESVKILVISFTFFVLFATIIALLEVRQNSKSLIDQTAQHKWIYGQLLANRYSQIVFSSLLNIVGAPLFFLIWKLKKQIEDGNNMAIHFLFVFTVSIRGISFILEFIFFKFFNKSFTDPTAQPPTSPINEHKTVTFII
ncbi:hypothetical protein SNEBB_005693 [Seison nebaliae]|nr:hypothetical protein SNEBB_005693 [Seison nebaliae]